MVNCQECGKTTGENEIAVIMQSGYQQVIFFCS